MKRHRRKHTAEFKARVAIEAIRGMKTMSEIASEFEIHPVMVSNWKKEMLDSAPNSSRSAIKPGISVSAMPISLRPQSANDMSATL